MVTNKDEKNYLGRIVGQIKGMKTALIPVGLAGLLIYSCDTCLTAGWGVPGKKITKETMVVDNEEKELIRDEEAGLSYTVEEGELIGGFGERVKPWGKRCVLRYSAGMPGGTKTCRYGNQYCIYIETRDGAGNVTKVVNEPVNYHKVILDVRRFEKDRKLLREAGLIVGE